MHAGSAGLTLERRHSMMPLPLVAPQVAHTLIIGALARWNNEEALSQNQLLHNIRALEPMHPVSTSNWN